MRVINSYLCLFGLCVAVIYDQNVFEAGRNNEGVAFTIHNKHATKSILVSNVAVHLDDASSFRIALGVTRAQVAFSKSVWTSGASQWCTSCVSVSTSRENVTWWSPKLSVEIAPGAMRGFFLANVDYNRFDVLQAGNQNFSNGVVELIAGADLNNIACETGSGWLFLDGAVRSPRNLYGSINYTLIDPTGSANASLTCGVPSCATEPAYVEYSRLEYYGSSAAYAWSIHNGYANRSILVTRLAAVLRESGTYRVALGVTQGPAQFSGGVWTNAAAWCTTCSSVMQVAGINTVWWSPQLSIEVPPATTRAFFVANVAPSGNNFSLGEVYNFTRCGLDVIAGGQLRKNNQQGVEWLFNSSSDLYGQQHTLAGSVNYTLIDPTGAADASLSCGPANTACTVGPPTSGVSPMKMGPVLLYLLLSFSLLW